MSKWFYYNEQGDKIEVTGGQLKGLAKAGLITPGTLVETEDGKKAPAKKVKGLTFVEATQPETAAIESAVSKSSMPNPTPSVEVNPFAIPVQAEVNPFSAATPVAAYPFAPPQQFFEPQSYASAQLVIERPSIWYGRAASYGVFVNGQKLQTLANGQTVTLSVPTGMVKLEVKWGVPLIAPVTMNLMAGQKKKITLHLKKHHQLITVLLVLLFLPLGIIYSLTVPPYVIEEEI